MLRSQQPGQRALAPGAVGPVVVNGPEGPADGAPRGSERMSASDSARTFSRFTAAIVRANVSILVFLCTHLLVFIAHLCYRGYTIGNAKKYNASYTDWKECAFRHFDGANPDAWKHVCGTVPQKRLPFSIMFMAVITLAMYGSIISTMHFTVIVRRAFILKFLIWLILQSILCVLGLTIRLLAFIWHLIFSVFKVLFHVALCRWHVGRVGNS
jgi:hypothetical protein